MRQVKRLFYMVLVNVIISVITVGVVLKLWERDHPPVAAQGTAAVVVVTATSAQSSNLPLIVNNAGIGATTPGFANTPLTGTQEIVPTPEMLVYRVKQGDTLGGLAVQFNVSVDDIMEVNGLTDPNSLFIGQIIQIPTAPLPRETPTAVPPTGIVSPTPRPSITPTAGSTPSATPTLSAQEAQVTVDGVIGAGTLANERVVLRRTGDGELSLAGWRLTDGKGNEYLFPQLTLYKGGAINLNTRTGQDTVIDLFWNLRSPIWTSGKIISIYDAQNNLRAMYTIP